MLREWEARTAAVTVVAAIMVVAAGFRDSALAASQAGFVHGSSRLHGFVSDVLAV